MLAIALLAGWSLMPVDTAGYIGWYPSLALDSRDRPHIAYGSESPSYDLKYAFWNGSGWVIQAVDTAGDVGRHTSIALDSQDRPHISYHDAHPNYDLKYAFWNGSSWVIQTVDAAGDVGLYTSIAIDSRDRPHISYYYDWGGYDLKYAFWNGLTWVKQTVDILGNVGLYTSIALDSHNHPHISYYEGGYGRVKYAFWNSSSWVIQIVDVWIGGVPTSIALDSRGMPHISYYNSTNGDLKYAFWNGSSWNIEIVDGSGLRAGYNGTDRALRIGSDDCPRIAYHRENPEDLFYAHRGCPPLEAEEGPGHGSGPQIIVYGQKAEVMTDERGTLSLYDPAGRALKSWNLEPGKSIIDWGRGLSPGVYILGLRTEKGRSRCLRWCPEATLSEAIILFQKGLIRPMAGY